MNERMNGHWHEYNYCLLFMYLFINDNIKKFTLWYICLIVLLGHSYVYSQVSTGYKRKSVK